jgi:hypothetical protein
MPSRDIDQKSAEQMFNGSLALLAKLPGGLGRDRETDLFSFNGTTLP